MWELQQRLLPKSAQSLQSGQTLVLIIDGADRLVDQRGQLISDWIPKTLPRRVHLVLSVSSDSSLGETLEQSQGAHVVALGPLEPSARARLVREELALYGKRLEESPFNNQVGLRPGLVGVWGESENCNDQAAEAASCPTQASCASLPQKPCARGSC